ncbi:hypothetical protein Syn7803C76_48 [Synechococcus phage ACG-2014b]|uniref:Uncharacterized protein n=2 Tax=Synechococcus phage ACG-2014b TaxID=1493508 RepID=A0A0E3EUI1_9CAUD|nr:2OG-Fe(II) oxygenase [Synechococcus phage ACG-2014b]YP_009779677.1 2OG-Fe(II) oxygenase [Synechococcus phage ACG-2014b]AIX17271.1 hypothetical protein Syn7803C61_49 [Synechococcus phage ACG-2014b]AIX17917.1 hypothetical protein Syn7803C68_49 [Synechococcus phage ACG-2014b]AIX18133.1 hypothetical protein Syn7803C69_49 [Synechococcus phage ACG-2014b]AIX19288.1 hypothetical protein Syn7803C76_48 [Synechococcus phage ACG-2014b]AIX19723.1 hypothetical protein Syn7803C78_48 [Synechococcus phage 
MILWYGNFKLDDDTVLPLVDKLKSITSTRDKLNKLRSSYYLTNAQRPERILDSFYEEIIKGATIDLGVHHRSQYKIPYWMQVYTTDMKSHHGYHDHFDADTQLSWVHFVRPTKEKRFCFVDSNGNKTFPNQQNEGDFILFPSWAPHEVEVNTSDDERIIIAGNIMFSALDLIAPNSDVLLKTSRRHNVEEIKNGQTIHLWVTTDYEGL